MEMIIFSFSFAHAEPFLLHYSWASLSLEGDLIPARLRLGLCMYVPMCVCADPFNHLEGCVSIQGVSQSSAKSGYHAYTF